jgi:chromosome segregation ATPase
MSQLRQASTESAAREAEFGADHPEPSNPPNLLDELRQCGQAARQQLERAHEQLRHVTALCDELRDVRSENDRLRAALEDLNRQVADGARRQDELRVEATAERDRAATALAVRSDLERRLAEVENRLRTATENLDALDSAAKQADRDRLTERERDNAQRSELVNRDIEAAQLRIEQLTAELHWACSANERLRALLNVFGVVDHLESRPGPD